MRIHWLIKYYFFAFVIIFFIVYLIENKQPYVDWRLYNSNMKAFTNNMIEEKNCKSLLEAYESEYQLNYTKNYFGFPIRNDRKQKKGLNLLKYLKYHIKSLNCSS